MSDESRARNLQVGMSLLGMGGGSVSSNSGADSAADIINDSGFMSRDWQVSTKAPKAPGIASLAPLAVAVAGLVAVAWIMRKGRA